MSLSSTPFRSAILDALRDRCGQAVSVSQGVPTGWAVLDSHMPARGLAVGGLHEWIGVCPAGDSQSRGSWTAPVSVLMHGAGAAVERAGESARCVVWVGRAVWCSPPALARRGLMGVSLFVDACSVADRLWATDLALRSGVCAAVIADGSGFDLSDTRRLQLGAEAGARVGGGLCLLARPPWEARELSAASTRWLVRRVVSMNTRRRWSVELLRCKGMQPSSLAVVHRPWVVERDDATGALCVVTDVRDGPGQEAAGAVGDCGSAGGAVARARTG